MSEQPRAEAEEGARSADEDREDVVAKKAEKWQRMFARPGSIRSFIERHPETFIRRARRGIPEEYRWATWYAAVGPKPEKGSDMQTSDEHYYALSHTEGPFSQQIRVDVPRTVYVNCDEKKLERVLNAYSNLNPHVGYCQGMNFVAGTLLAVSRNQERETFEVFKNLLEYDGLKFLYADHFPLLKRYLDAFEILLRRELPRLHDHFVTSGIPFTSFLTPWFMSLYAAVLPWGTVLVIWDSILCDGLPVILNVAVSLLKVLEHVLLPMDLDQTTSFFKTMRSGDEECDAVTIGELVTRQAHKIELSDETYKILNDPDYVCRSDLDMHMDSTSRPPEPDALQDFASWWANTWSRVTANLQGNSQGK